MNKVRTKITTSNGKLTYFVSKPNETKYLANTLHMHIN